MVTATVATATGISVSLRAALGISFLVKIGSLAMLLAMPVIQQLVMCEHDVCDRVF